MFFTPIDIQTWPRSQMFRCFSQMAPTGYSITVEDVSGLTETLKEKGYKFFSTYLWLVTKCLNEQQEFKIAQNLLDSKTLLKVQGNRFRIKKSHGNKHKCTNAIKNHSGTNFPELIYAFFFHSPQKTSCVRSI